MLYIRVVIDLKKIVKVAGVFSLTGKYLRLAQKKESDIINVKSRWALDLLNKFNISVQIIGKPINHTGPNLFIGNHISYLDIPVLLHACPEISFVSKKEVKSWPIIGKAAVKMQTIFVERGNIISRTTAKTAITTSLLSKNQSIAIFPSGTTAIKTSASWKKGAFEIAELNNILVQPFRIRYEPLSAAAYVGQDNLLQHMYRLFKFKKIQVTIEFHEPVNILNSIEECLLWKKWCEN